MRMKIKDMEQAIIDATPVAVGRLFGDDRLPVVSENRAWGVRPATIIAVRQPRKVHTAARWDFSGHTTNDGVKVKFSDGSTEVVPPMQVLAPVAEYEEIRDRREQRQNSEADAIAQSKAKCEAAVATLGVGTVEPIHTTWDRNAPYKIRGYRVALSASEAEALAAKVG